MASRQEEKEKRKQERLAREAQAAAAAKRKRLLQLLGGAIVAAAIVAGVVFAASKGGGSGDSSVDNARLTSVAAPAGCVYRSFKEEGREHVTERLTAANYKTNPPTSGAHNPNPAPDGLYVTGNEPEIENWVHTLEHGRVEFQYKPGTAAAAVRQLETLFKENVKGSGDGYHSVLMQNNTKMPFQVAAVAWRHYMGCKAVTPKSIEAMRVFRDELIDKGPETVP